MRHVNKGPRLISDPLPVIDVDNRRRLWRQHTSRGDSPGTTDVPGGATSRNHGDGGYSNRQNEVHGDGYGQFSFVLFAIVYSRALEVLWFFYPESD